MTLEILNYLSTGGSDGTAQFTTFRPRQLPSMSARHRVAKAAQVFPQVHFHLHCRVEGHRVQVRVEFWQQPEALTLCHPRGLDARFVIGKPLLWRQAGHADVDARFLRVTPWVGGTHFPILAHGGIEQHNVDIVVVLRLWLRAKHLERAALHRLGFLLRLRTGRSTMRCVLDMNISTTSTFNTLANFSNPATDGALTPRSTRLMNSTEQPMALANCTCVRLRSRRKAPIRCPSFS